MKRVDSTHYIHPSGLNVVQKDNKSWSVFDTYSDNGQLKNELSSYHKSKNDARRAASFIHRKKMNESFTHGRTCRNCGTVVVNPRRRKCTNNKCRGTYFDKESDESLAKRKAHSAKMKDVMKSLNVKESFAIATRSDKAKSGWARVRDTKFGTEDAAHKYGMKYHTDKYGSKMYKVVKHPDKDLD